ncbi:hypothetical protein STEG23_006394 [Scotinomys teguina]
MTVTPLGRDHDCSLKIQEPDVPVPWFLDPGGWSKTAMASLYFIFPGICTLSLNGNLTVDFHVVGKAERFPLLLSFYWMDPRIMVKNEGPFQCLW